MGDRIPTHAQVLLSDFFQICDAPNEAEKHMLTVACGLRDVGVTAQWCKYTFQLLKRVTHSCTVESKRSNVKSVTDGQTLLQDRKRRSAQAIAQWLSKMREGTFGYRQGRHDPDNQA